jgi:hypothetical protein
MNINLGTEEIPQLIFWFSVTVAVIASPESSRICTKTLYFVIKGSLLDWNRSDTCNPVGPPNTGYSYSTNTALQIAGISSENTSIYRICFRLHDHGTVFMPSIMKYSFTPVSDDVLQLLTDIQSLSKAKQFWVYIPSEGFLNFRTRLNRIHQRTFTDDFTIQRVYKNNMVCDKWTNFNHFVRKKNEAKPQSTLHSGKHNSDPPPRYQRAGMKRKGDSAIDLIVNNNTNILTIKVFIKMMTSTKLL